MLVTTQYLALQWSSSIQATQALHRIDHSPLSRAGFRSDPWSMKEYEFIIENSEGLQLTCMGGHTRPEFRQDLRFLCS